MNTTRLLLIVLVSSLIACSERAAEAPAPDPTDPATYAEGQAYTVRGVIAQLPSDGPPPAELKIHHEHIPDFIGETGEVFVNSEGVPGMKAMVMAFPNLAPGVEIESLEIGDKIEFDFLVRWEDAPGGRRSATWLVSRLSSLPEDAEISFENKPSP